MKAIKCTKKQFEEFKITYTKSGTGKILYNKMMDHFKRTSPERYNGMKVALNVVDPYWLYTTLELSNYKYLSYAYRLKDTMFGPRTIDGQSYTFLSLDKADAHIHYIMYMSKIKYPKAYYISQTLDYLNTYLCTYNL